MKSEKVDYRPWVIKASNSLLFVQAGYPTKLLFIYELNSLKLKQKIDNPAVYCRLSFFNSNTYRYNSESKSVLVYDGNGDYKEEIIINNVDTNLISGSDDGALIIFNGNLLMASRSVRRLIKFSRNK